MCVCVLACACVYAMEHQQARRQLVCSVGATDTEASAGISRRGSITRSGGTGCSMQGAGASWHYRCPVAVVSMMGQGQKGIRWLAVPFPFSVERLRFMPSPTATAARVTDGFTASWERPRVGSRVCCPSWQN